MTASEASQPGALGLGRLIAPGELPADRLRYLIPENGVAEPQVVVLVDTCKSIDLESDAEVDMATVQTFAQGILCVEAQFLRPPNPVEQIGFLDEFGAWYDVRRLEADERAHLDDVNQDLGRGALVELASAEHGRIYEEILHDWAERVNEPSRAQLRVLRSPRLRRKYLWRGETATVIHPPKEIGGAFMVRRSPAERMLRYRWHEVRPANDL